MPLARDLNFFWKLLVMLKSHNKEQDTLFWLFHSLIFLKIRLYIGRGQINVLFECPLIDVTRLLKT